MTRRHSSPIDDFFGIVRSAPKILQDVIVGIAIVAIVQAFLSEYLPIWLVTLLVAAYTIYSLFREGKAVLESRTFRIFGIALLTFLIDLYFTLA